MTCRDRIAFMLLTGAAFAPVPPAAAGSPPAVRYQRPFVFEPNHGQAGPAARFVSRGPGYSLSLLPAGAALSLSGDGSRPTTVTMTLGGANPSPEMVAERPLPGRSHYFIGDRPGAWRTGVTQHGAVRYRDVYPGVDLVFHGSNDRELEYDFVLAPGADPAAIRIRFEGASRPKLRAGGELLLRAGNGEVIQRAPVAYQEADGVRRRVAARFELRARGEVAFRLGAYDRTKPLVIDPVLSYSTYLGGVSLDRGLAIAVDAAGSAYVTGLTCSANFPAAPLPGVPAGTSCNAFVTKFAPDGATLVYSTYFGGALAGDHGTGIAVDAAGSAVVVGQTCSADFPAVGAVQPAYRGGCDAFVTRLSPAGDAIVHSTFLGGSAQDQANGVALDGAGRATVVGFTFASNFPVLNAVQPASGGALNTDGFVTRLSADGSAFVYSTYLGGANLDSATGVAVDSAGGAWVTGTTFSTNFPIANAYQPVKGGTSSNAFLTRFNPEGNALVYSTYLGGNCSSGGVGVAVDAAGSAHLVGSTCSTDFPVANALQPTRAGSGGFADLFVTRFTPSGAALDWSTYLGGASSEFAHGIALDPAGNVYVSGWSFSSDFPVVDAVQAANAGPYDVVVAKISAAGSPLVYSTYVGGSGDDLRTTAGNGIAVDASGNAYVAGTTFSTNFPTVNPFQSAKAGNDDVFVFKIAAAPPPQCADGMDNADAEDTLADAADAGCHTDGNPANAATYDPADEDETDVCGDGILHPAEQCDDGNTQGGDGCSSSCRFENRPPDCAAAAAGPSDFWPPNHEMVPILITGITDPDGDAVAVVVDAITQDEPVAAEATGATCPDASGVGTDSPSVRAERSGSEEDGRVYQIAFTGRDGAGAACSGVVTVCIPHDRRGGPVCVDQGPLHDATACP